MHTLEEDKTEKFMTTTPNFPSTTTIFSNDINILSEYEEKLLLVGKFAKQNQQAEGAIELLKSIERSKLDKEIAIKLDSIENTIKEIFQFMS